jgi:hypothetical protein
MEPCTTKWTRSLDGSLRDGVHGHWPGLVTVDLQHAGRLQHDCKAGKQHEGMRCSILDLSCAWAPMTWLVLLPRWSMRVRAAPRSAASHACSTPTLALHYSRFHSLRRCSCSIGQEHHTSDHGRV